MNTVVVTAEESSPTKPEMPSWQLCTSSRAEGTCRTKVSVQLFFKKVAAADGDAEHRRDGRCQRRAGQAQPHGEDEDVIEHHIEQASAQGGHHGKGRVAVVADEAERM